MNKIMIELKNRLEEILDYIKDKNDVIYLDYPFHLNVGDLLIFQGAIQFFKENKVKIKIYRSVEDYNIKEIKKHITPNTTILCHGGGNFGDIYKSHQKLREEIAVHFKENVIIVLPQTAFFSNINAMMKSAEKFKKNNKLVIFSRDSRSLEIFKEFSDKVILMPDMAHNLYGKLKINDRKNNEKLFFLRVDCEAGKEQEKLGLGKDIETKDWVTVLEKQDFQKWIFLARMTKIGNIFNSSIIKSEVSESWIKYSELLTNRYSELFSGYDEVITSRMHGHILSCLVDTKNTLLDNSYGKNKGYFQSWTKDIDTTKMI